jgi:predicted SprT family Zn-dependent metalloprotease
MKKEMIKFTIRFRFPTEKYPEPLRIINKAMNQLPNEVKESLIKNPIMFSAEYKDFRANALCIGHEDFKDEKYLIHLNHHVWDYDEKRIIRTIHHEIAHVFLKHGISNKSWLKSKEEQDKMEGEADKLVESWEKK